MKDNEQETVMQEWILLELAACRGHPESHARFRRWRKLLLPLKPSLPLRTNWPMESRISTVSGRR